MKKTKNKKYNYQTYAWGGNVDPNMISGLGGMGGNLLSGLVGQDTGAGGFLSGAGSGAGLGASIGSIVPGLGTGIGAIAGGLIGGVGGLLGNNAKQKAEEKQRKNNKSIVDKSRFDQFNSNLDTNNENPYGDVIFKDGGTIHIKPENRGKFTAYKKRTGKTTEEALHSPDPHVRQMANFARNAAKWKHEDGGDIIEEQINIEKGELQIDPETGKILREYKGINPETGGLYEPHSKGKDTKNNIVTATPGTFIITAAKSKAYKDAIENNDVITQNTILQNIKNYKDSKGNQTKMALGSYVDPTKPPMIGAINSSLGSNTMGIINQPFGLPQMPFRSAVTQPRPTMDNQLVGKGIQGLPSIGSGNNRSFNGLNTLMQYAPSLLNIGRGMFGQIEQQSNVAPNYNPYRSQILNNMPQEVSLNPLVNRINRNQRAQFNQIDNTTSGNPIARANKNNIFGNTQNQLADIYMQQQGMNNQVRSQRGNIYNNLGQQDVAANNRAEQINLGIYDSNLQNKAAKSNLLNTGLGQLQQVYQNSNNIKSQKENDALRTRMLYEMFPNLRFYENTFTR